MPSPGASGASMESSDELAVVAAVETMSVTDRYIEKSQPEMPPGACDAPDVQPTASEATEPRRIRQDAVQGGSATRSGTLLVTVPVRPAVTTCRPGTTMGRNLAPRSQSPKAAMAQLAS